METIAGRLLFNPLFDLLIRLRSIAHGGKTRVWSFNYIFNINELRLTNNFKQDDSCSTLFVVNRFGMQVAARSHQRSNVNGNNNGN